MIEIDGADGSGGGQIVRSALSLSMATGKPFTLVNVRAGRKNPGLQRQHLTCVLAAVKVCGGQVDGAVPQSKRLAFWPGTIAAGDYRFDIGSAGSAPLVLQTVGPALSLADRPSSVTIVGGTHNPMAPPFEFLDKAFAPAIARMGWRWELELVRHGFYPAGGGQIRATIEPGPLRGLELLERDKRQRTGARVIVSRLPDHVAERERKKLAQHLKWPLEKIEIRTVDADSPGNVIILWTEGERVSHVVTSLGRLGLPAERVAKEALDEFADYQRGESPVGEHLSDQLLLPMGLAAWQGRPSVFRATTLSEHAKTHVELIRRFLPIAIEVSEPKRGECEFRLSPLPGG